MSGRTLGKWLPVACAVGLALPLKSARCGLPDSGVVQPPVLLLPNYGRILIGSQGGMEAGALVVRAKATEAAWYNPAGLVRSRWHSFSANASLYQLVKTDFESGGTTASSSNVTTLPVFVGTSNWITRGEGDLGKLAWGYTIVTPVAWQSDVGSFDEFDYNGGVDRVTTKSHTDYNTLGIGAVLSYAVTDPYAPRRFTLGMSAGLYMTDLGVQTSKFDDWSDGATAYTKSHQLDMSLSARHLGITLGAYYGFAENWESALIVRLPGIKLSAAGDYDEHELITGDAAVLANEYYASDTHDAGVEAEWEIPLELTAGVAYNGDKFDAELDLSYHAGAGTYDVFPAGSYAIRSGSLGALASSSALRDPLTTTGDSILNVAFGCRYEISEKFRVHAGFRTCKSHVEATATEDIFQSVDLYMLTFGLSTQTENTFTSLGLALGFGDTDHFALEDLGSGAPVGGELSVSTTSFFIGASFKL